MNTTRSIDTIETALLMAKVQFDTDVTHDATLSPADKLTLWAEFLQGISHLIYELKRARVEQIAAEQRADLLLYMQSKRRKSRKAKAA